MGVAEDFKNFCDSISISSEKKESISYRYKRITRQLNKDFWSTNSEDAHSLYVGSYGRGTAIKGVSDVDIRFQLPSKLYDNYNCYQYPQSTLLQAIRNSIKNTYPTTSISADGQVVVTKFDDNIKFEVLPVFLLESNTFYYPDTNDGGSWFTTNPKPEIEAIRNVDLITNGNLRCLCKMMRAWRNYWDVPIGGFLIDTLAYQFIQTWSEKNESFLYYDWLSRDFFKYLASIDEKQEYWKAPGSGRYVWGSGFQYKAKRSYNLAVEAIQNQTNSYFWTANQKWREVYGTVFPE